MLRGVKWHHPERQEQLHVPWLKSACSLHSAVLLQYVTKSNSVDEPGTQYKDRDQLAIRESSFSQNTCDLPLIQTPILVSFFRKNTTEEELLL